MHRSPDPFPPRRAYTRCVIRKTVRARRSPAIDVLYIGGCPRSGSTLLDRMLSQVDGHVSAGELVHLWERGILNNELCGCGEPFWSCPFWTEVGRDAFGGWGSVDIDDIIALQHRVDRNRYIIFMLFPWLSRRYRRDLDAYAPVLRRLYGAVAARGVVVDSSKHPSTAFLLRRVPGVRLRLVHLVRDARGVVFSLSKRVRRPEVLDHDAFMHRRTATRGAAEWVFFNALFHVLRLTGTRSTRVRYEDVVSRPLDALTSVGGGGTRELAFVDAAGVELEVDHTVAGNPMRFAHGRVELRLDEDWRTTMHARDRRVTTAIAGPLLRLYGYRLAVR
jgi:hypothetical protein